jgi:hypothetical protein
MVAFGIGGAVPLIAIGLLSREALSRWRGRLTEADKGGKVLLGGVLVAIGLLVATGLDERLETFLVDTRPPGSRASPPSSEASTLSQSVRQLRLGAQVEQTTSHWCSRCRGIWYGYLLGVACQVCGNRHG